MKIHTTNYYNTFIQIAEDSPATTGQLPPEKENKTIANIQFDQLKNKPYHYTSDDVVFEAFAEKNDISASEKATERNKFFSKGQPCLRSSPLTKRYGWGVHSDTEGKIALVAAGSEEYEKLAADTTLKQWKAMRNKKT